MTDQEIAQAHAQWDAWRIKYTPETLNGWRYVSAYRHFWMTVKALDVIHYPVAWKSVQLMFTEGTAGTLSYIKKDEGTRITETLKATAAQTLWEWCQIHLGGMAIKEGLTVTVVVSTPDSFTPWCLEQERKCGGESEKWEQFALCDPRDAECVQGLVEKDYIPTD